jgi:hypothetical protein
MDDNFLGISNLPQSVAFEEPSPQALQEQALKEAVRAICACPGGGVASEVRIETIAPGRVKVERLDPLLGKRTTEVVRLPAKE